MIVIKSDRISFEFDPKIEQVRNQILSLAEREDEKEKAQKDKDEVIKRYMLKA